VYLNKNATTPEHVLFHALPLPALSPLLIYLIFIYLIYCILSRLLCALDFIFLQHPAFLPFCFPSFYLPVFYLSAFFSLSFCFLPSCFLTVLRSCRLYFLLSCLSAFLPSFLSALLPFYSAAGLLSCPLLAFQSTFFAASTSLYAVCDVPDGTARSSGLVMHTKVAPLVLFGVAMAFLRLSYITTSFLVALKDLCSKCSSTIWYLYVTTRQIHCVCVRSMICLDVFSAKK
jgi:hypothetical protein